MIGILVAIVLGLATAVLQTAALPAFGASVALLHLPAIAIVSRISSFRYAQAAIIALTAGLLTDLFVAPSFGGETLILLGLTLALILLFTHVLTNSSLPALLALNAAAFLLVHAAALARALLRAALAGEPAGALLGWSRLAPLLAALPWQLAAVIAVAIVLALFRRTVGSVVMFR